MVAQEAFEFIKKQCFSLKERPLKTQLSSIPDIARATHERFPQHSIRLLKKIVYGTIRRNYDGPNFHGTMYNKEL